MLRCTTFCDHAVTVEPHSTLNFSKGVVKSSEFLFGDAAEIESLPGVEKAVPILSFRDGAKVKTGTWILTFDSRVSPEYINVCWLSLCMIMLFISLCNVDHIFCFITKYEH